MLNILQSKEVVIAPEVYYAIAFAGDVWAARHPRLTSSFSGLLEIWRNASLGRERVGDSKRDARGLVFAFLRNALRLLASTYAHYHRFEPCVKEGIVFPKPLLRENFA